MPLLIREPSSVIRRCFERAMASLASHPDRARTSDHYEFLPPLPRYALDSDAARLGEFQRAELVGWRYLVRDTDGLTIVDIDDDFDLTYSSVQKGGAAERYERVLHSLDHDVAKSDDECDVEVVETPELGASALVATIGGKSPRLRFDFARKAGSRPACYRRRVLCSRPAAIPTA